MSKWSVGDSVEVMSECERSVCEDMRRVGE